MSRRTLKRSSPSPKLEVSCLQNIGSDTLKEKRRKLGTKQLSKSKSTKNKVDSNPVKDPSDSSSDEFERPPPLSELKLDNLEVKKETSLPDFTSIENNILKGVTRLSDSDDSDLDEVTSTHSCPVTADNIENGTSSKTPQKSKSKLSEASKNRENVKKNAPKAKGKGKSKQNRTRGSTSQLSKKNDPVAQSSLDVSKMDVSQLLALGEGSSTSIKAENKDQHSDSDSESDVSDWEDVEGLDLKPEKHTIPQEGVEVRLEMPDIYRRRNKKSFDVESHLRRRLNRIKRELQVLIHKVHLLCWIAHGHYINTVLNSEVLMGISLSLIPSQHCLPQKHTNLKYLEQIVKWFTKTVTLVETPEKNPPEPLLDSLEKQLQEKTANSTRDLVLMFICLLRAIGVKVRLMLSFQPLPLKPSNEDLLLNKSKGRRSSALNEEKELKKEPKTEDNENSTDKKNDKQYDKTSKESEKTKPAKQPKKGPENSSKKKTHNPKMRTAKKSEIESDVTDEKMEKLKRTLRERKKVTKKYKEPSSSSDEGERAEAKEVSNSGSSIKEKSSNLRTEQGSKKQAKNVTEGNQHKSSNKKSNRTTQCNSDSDFEPVLKKSNDVKQMAKDESSDSENDFEPKKVAVKRKSTGKTVDRRVLSSDSSSGDIRKKKSKKYVDVWTEVYLEEEEQWISVDVPTAKIHCVAELYSRATQPVAYVIGFTNDQTLKDVTRRYCTQYSTVTRKLRVDEEWWKQSLKPFLGARTARDREEDEELERLMLERPLPTTFKELKNHPLYALKDDLLKFEAIYPPDAPPLGYIKGKPIYARECVHVLHSREAWIKEAKVVRLGEQPYKIVKARPKYDKMTGQFLKDLPLEVFGSWQVDDYVPPVAVDGKVPRNEYGNVELFKPSMLPKGTVHLPITGLNRVARKIGVDCAPAMIGFDFHAGGTHPVFDGYVVCEEFKDILVDAWNQEQEEAAKRQQEKLDKRVYGNWRRLIKGLLIRERLKLRYSFGEEAGPSEPRLLSINESNKLLSVMNANSKNRKKSNAGRGRKSNNLSRPGGSTQKGKRKVTNKRRKVESEEEEEEPEISESDEDDFDSDKDWD